MSEAGRDGFALYEAHNQKVALLEAELRPENRAALFDALEAAGIHVVTVIFDGYGDSGQIESIDAFKADNNPADLSSRHLSFKTVQFEELQVITKDFLARDAIEAMSFDFLGETHCGWENSDGAYGDFTFNVPDRTITLDFNERFTDSTFYRHEF